MAETALENVGGESSRRTSEGFGGQEWCEGPSGPAGERAVSPGEGHSASQPPTPCSAVPPPDAPASRNVTQGEEGQAGGGRKVYSICGVRREEEQMEGCLNKGWWGRSVIVESTMKKETTDLFFSRAFVPK